MTETEPITDPDAITDLSQVRWTTREAPRSEHPALPSEGWHIIGEVGHDPDPYSRERFDLHVQIADDGDGGSCEPWLAEQVAMKLSETDQTIRWQRDRAIDAVNAQRLDAGERDEELRWDLGNALGWELGDDPGGDDDGPTWAQLVRSARTLREAHVPAVAAEVVAEALEVNGPGRALAHDSVWTPDRILEMLAEHGLKVVHA